MTNENEKDLDKDLESLRHHAENYKNYRLKIIYSEGELVQLILRLFARMDDAESTSNVPTFGVAQIRQS